MGSVGKPDYVKLDKLFCSLNKYQEGTNKNKTNLKLTRDLLLLIKNIKQKKSLESYLKKLGVILLFIGLIILFWTELQIYFIYFLRLVIVHVSLITLNSLD